MQVEALTLRVWLLLVIVGWAALVCILEFAGMGAHVQQLPPDLSLAPPIPPLPASLPARLGPLSQYAAISDRPAFAEDRKPHPFLLTGSSTQSAPVNARLTGVILTPELKMATLTIGQNTSVRLRQGGEVVQGWRLLSLEPRDATVEGPNGTQSLQLEVFNGQGGQPPTVLRAPTKDMMQVSSPTYGGGGQAGGGHMTSAKNISVIPVDTANGPPSNEDQLRSIRERIEQRRQQLRLQQQNQQQHTNDGSSP